MPLKHVEKLHLRHSNCMCPWSFSKLDLGSGTCHGFTAFCPVFLQLDEIKLAGFHWDVQQKNCPRRVKSFRHAQDSQREVLICFDVQNAQGLRFLLVQFSCNFRHDVFLYLQYGWNQWRFNHSLLTRQTLTVGSHHVAWSSQHGQWSVGFLSVSHTDRGLNMFPHTWGFWGRKAQAKPLHSLGHGSTGAAHACLIWQYN